MKMKYLSLALLSALAMTGCGGGGSSESAGTGETGGADGSGSGTTPEPTLELVTVNHVGSIDADTKGLTVQAKWDLLADVTGVEYTLCLSGDDPEVCAEMGSVLDGNSLTFKLPSLFDLENVKVYVQASKDGVKSKGAEVALDWQGLTTSYREDSAMTRVPFIYIDAAKELTKKLQWVSMSEIVEVRYIDSGTERTIGDINLSSLAPPELTWGSDLRNNSKLGSTRLSGDGYFVITWFDGDVFQPASFKGVSVHKVEPISAGGANFINVDFISAAEIGGGHKYAYPRTVNASYSGDSIIVEFLNGGDTPETQYEFLKLTLDGAEYVPTTGTLTDLELGYDFESPIYSVERKASYDFVLSRNEVTDSATLRVYDSIGSPEMTYELARPEGFNAGTDVFFEFVPTSDPDLLAIALSYEGASHSESGVTPDQSTGIASYLKLDVNDVIGGVVNDRYSMMPMSTGVINSLSEGSSYNMYNKFSLDFADHYVLSEVFHDGEGGGYVFAQLTESPIVRSD